MHRPEFVTFTGLDESTDLGRARALAERYPIEWAVLLSPMRQGKQPRFPRLGLVAEMRKHGLRLAAHLCGEYAGAVLASGTCRPLRSLLGEGFGRVQINTARRGSHAEVVAGFAREYVGPAARGILQTRDGFPDDDQVDWLYDRSGGRGELPSEWPRASGTPGRRVGYAGGLGPESIQRAQTEIGLVAGDYPYWIDMESRIRTEDVLDLDKCEEVAQAVYEV